MSDSKVDVLKKKVTEQERTIEDYEKLIKSSREQARFLTDVFEASAIGLYVIDVNNYNIVMANKAAGFDKLEEGATCHMLTHKSPVPCKGNHLCPLHEVKNKKKPVITEHIHFDKEGNQINVEVYGCPIFDKEGM